MVNIELTTQQAEELKRFYLTELEKVQKQEEVIKQLIGKLGVNTPVVEAPKAKVVTEEAPKQAIAEVKVKKTATKEKAAKPEVVEVEETKGFGWRKFIIDKLQEHQKPLSSKDFINMYEKQFKTNVTDSKNAKLSMNQALFLLRKKENLIVSIKTDGKREKLFDLAQKENPGKPIEAAEPAKPAKAAKTKAAKAAKTTKSRKQKQKKAKKEVVPVETEPIVNATEQINVAEVAQPTL